VARFLNIYIECDQRVLVAVELEQQVSSGLFSGSLNGNSHYFELLLEDWISYHRQMNDMKTWKA
jgi:hypothetical protein